MSSIGQVALMAAIVATLWYWPIGVAAALIAASLGVPLDAFVSFGGAFNRYVGMTVWWLIMFVPALAYAALVFPWDE